MNRPSLYSTGQAAQILRLSRRRIQMLVKERNLGIRIGKTLGLTITEILELSRRPKPGRRRTGKK